MKVLMLATGSRGDVQPLVALGCGFKRRGHDVIIGAAPDHQQLIEEHNLIFKKAGPNVKELIQDFFAKGGTNTQEILEVMYSAVETDCIEICRDSRPDVIMYHYGIGIGASIGEYFSIPAFEFYFVPWNPSLEFPSFPASANGWSNPTANFYTHLVDLENTWFGQKLFQWTKTSRMNLLKMKHSLPSIGDWWNRRRNGVPLLCAWSSSVLPLPSNQKYPDYVQTGYWMMGESDDYKPPELLTSFLAQEPTPLAIGFGSMVPADAEKQLKIIIAALRKTGQRAVFLGGYSGADANSDLINQNKDILAVLNQCPHSWLFPKVRAVIHHGGAGTTAAGLRAGKPTIIISHMMPDQPFWGRVLQKLGCSPAPIEHAQLDEQSLVDAIQKVISDPKMLQVAQEISQKLQKENGVDLTVDLILQMVADRGATWWDNPQRPQLDERNEILSSVAEDGSKPASEAVWRLMKLLFEENQFHGVLAYTFYALDTFKYEVPAEVVKDLVLPSLRNTGSLFEADQWKEALKDACTQR